LVFFFSAVFCRSPLWRKKDPPGFALVTVSAFTAEDSGEYWNQQLGIASKVPVLAAWSDPWHPAAIHPRREFLRAGHTVCRTGSQPLRRVFR
jgi:hypothetical protein